MKKIATQQLTVGMTAMLEVGSPVRKWLRNLPSGRKRLTPLQFTPSSHRRSRLTSKMQHYEVKIAKLMLPYAIVYHHDGQRWVKLWLDTREVVLFEATRF